MTHEELHQAGFSVDAQAYSRLCRYAELLLHANRSVNLVSRQVGADLWPAHICDSLAAVPFLRQANVQELLDLGTGGGFPGFPLAIALADTRVWLLDSTEKKIRALAAIAADPLLQDMIECFIAERAEVAAHDEDLRERFDAVVSRAVAPLSVLLELCAGFIRVGGHCCLFKSVDAAAREIRAAEPVARACRMEFVGTHRYPLPAGFGERTLVIYQSSAPPPAATPRAFAQIKRRPLGG